MDTLSKRSDIIKGEKNKSHSILWQNKNNLLNPNNNIIVVTIMIEVEIE